MHAIICRKFEEFFKYEDYTFGALTYYVKVLFSNRNKHYSKEVADKIGKNGPLTRDDLHGVKGLVWEHAIIGEKYSKDKFQKMPEKVYDLEALDGDFVKYSGIIESFACKSSNGV